MHISWNEGKLLHEERANPHSSKGVICLGHATLTWHEYRPPKTKTIIKTITVSDDHAVDHALPFSPLEIEKSPDRKSTYKISGCDLPKTPLSFFPTSWKGILHACMYSPYSWSNLRAGSLVPRIPEVRTRPPELGINWWGWIVLVCRPGNSDKWLLATWV